MLVRITSGDLCGEVIADVTIGSTIDSFNDTSYQFPQTAWKLFYPAVAYFKANFSSPQVTILHSQFQSISATVYDDGMGWVNSLDLYSSQVATEVGQMVGLGFHPPEPPNIFFYFEPWRLFMHLNASMNSTIALTAVVSINFAQGTGRNHMLRQRSLLELDDTSHHHHHHHHSRLLHLSTKLYVADNTGAGGRPQHRHITEAVREAFWEELLDKYFGGLVFTLIHTALLLAYLVIKRILIQQR